MTRTSRPDSGSVRTATGGPSHNVDRPTVATLGIQARLVPADLDRQHEFRNLITSCEILRQDCERLFQRMIEFLENDTQDGRSSLHRSSE
jgi:hypothetical protein